MFTCVLGHSYQYPNLSEGADRVGGQLRGDKQGPFSGVTKSGRGWRKMPESDARSVGERPSWMCEKIWSPKAHGYRYSPSDGLVSQRRRPRGEESLSLTEPLTPFPVQALGVYLYGEAMISECPDVIQLARACFRQLQHDMPDGVRETVSALLYAT